jgi:hypothetical protein
MSCRIALAIALAAVLTIASREEAGAAEPDKQNGSGWSFDVAPYFWTPWIDTTFNSRTRNGVATTTSSVAPDQYLPHLRLGVLIAGEAHYERFSILTDFIYMNLGASQSGIKSFDVERFLTPLRSSVNFAASASLQVALWTQAAGYTIVQHRWGNLDVIAGFRYLRVDETTNYGLSEAQITGPGGRTVALAGQVASVLANAGLPSSGSLDVTKNVWNGIVGVRGRIRLPDTNWFVPYYLDVGSGDSDFTWQIFGGLGYQTGWFSVSIGYRYLDFQNSGDTKVQDLELKGPLIAANFRF